MRLTIDVGLQRVAERALRDGIALAKEDEKWNANGGAIVALDPRDGAVLAMASNPTYKPSVYVGRVDPKKLEPLTVEKVAKERNYPGINRAVAGVYPPGSTFKPLTALAAISDGLLSPHEYIQCTPYVEYGLDKFPFKNWNPFTNAADDADDGARAVLRHVLLRPRQPLLRARRERAQVLDGDAGLGEEVRLRRRRQVSTSAVRPPASCRRPPGASGIGRTAWDKAWNPGDLIQLAIGQKDMTVTPLQMARFYAALANGGKLVTPYLVSAVEQPGNDEQPPVTVRAFPPAPPQVIDVNPEALEYVREGLYEATHDAEGTSSGVFGSFPVPVAGKTGTAEKVVNLPGYPLGHQEDQAWWCGWGPYDGGTYVTEDRLAPGADRRLRPDRERRSRRHSGGAGGAEGVRALVPGAGRRPGRGAE